MGYLSNIKKTFKIKHCINYFVIIIFSVIMFSMYTSGYLGRNDIGTLTKIAYSVILAVSLNLVVGFLGELSLGHAAFMCVGAYLGSFVSNILFVKIGNEYITLIITMLVGGLCAAVFGFIIGLPALRLKGDYLAIATLAFGEIIRNIFKNIKIFGGAQGLTLDLYYSEILYIVSFVVLLFVLFICQNLIRSKHGRAVTAIRDNEIAAKAMGIHVVYYKLFIFVIAAFLAGIAGVLYGASIGIVTQETFSYNYSIEILVMVVLGGMGSINGSIIAASLITYLNVFLQDQFSNAALAPVKLIVYAIILIFIVLYNNAPFFQIIKNKIGLKKIYKKIFSKGKPEIINDDEAEWHRIETKISMDEVLSVDIKKREGEFSDPDKRKKGDDR